MNEVILSLISSLIPAKGNWETFFPLDCSAVPIITALILVCFFQFISQSPSVQLWILTPHPLFFNLAVGLHSLVQNVSYIMKNVCVNEHNARCITNTKKAVICFLWLLQRLWSSLCLSSRITWSPHRLVSHQCVLHVTNDMPDLREGT